MVHHDWLLEAVQLVFEVTVNEVTPAGEVTPWLEGVTDSEGGPFSIGFVAML